MNRSASVNQAEVFALNLAERTCTFDALWSFQSRTALCVSPEGLVRAGTSENKNFYVIELPGTRQEMLAIHEL